MDEGGDVDERALDDAFWESGFLSTDEGVMPETFFVSFYIRDINTF